MSSQGGSIRPNSLSSRDACRLLATRVQALSDDSDPAPWHVVHQELIESFAGDDEAAYVRKAKLWERTKLLLLRALLAGELKAHFSDGDETQDIPGWAWAGAESVGHPWFDSRLPLDVLLPDDWKRWCSHLVFLDGPALESWIDRQDPTSTRDLPYLPPPHDEGERPDPIKYRLPPDRPFVTLSEALSWIANGISLDCERLHRAICENAFGALDVHAALKRAVAEITMRASDEQIAVRGKYVESHATDERSVLTAKIESVRFDDFRQFNILYDGLSYGEGLTWSGGGDLIGRELGKGRLDAFRSVTVNRADLLKHFPPKTEAAQTPEEVLRTTHEDVVAWCRRWIAQGKGNGMDKAWPDFNRHPAHRGLSRDDVFRPAWREAKVR